MKYLLLPVLLACFQPLAWSQAPLHCGTELYRERYALDYKAPAENPQLEETLLQNRGIIVIPVVVHVVYQTAQQNISQEQIESQLDVLNDDYRAENDNLDIIPAVFQSLIADTEIEFCLAVRDPEGNAASGITRTQTSKDDIGLSTDVHYADDGGAGAWDPLQYLNIWVADMGENIVGRASFPGSVPLAEDGVVIDPRYFGTIGLAAGSAPYHLGRTAVHEVGHYLNLLHPWGLGLPSCLGDDLVADTPVTSEDYLQQCPSTLQASCGSLDMYTNYMYYTDDACMAQFSPGQKVRMLATLLSLRLGLTASQGCVPVGVDPEPGLGLLFSIYPNPSSGEVVFDCKGPEGKLCRIQVFDAIGRRLCVVEATCNQPVLWSVPASFANGMYWVMAETEGNPIIKNWELNR